jgi:tyrosine-protein kinase Etk/Wzc
MNTEMKSNILSPVGPAPDDDDVNLLALWHNLVSHRWLFARIAGGVILLSVIYLLFAVPVYKANVLLQVDESQGSALGALSDVASALSLNKSIDGELDILTSRAVLAQAIDVTQARVTVSVTNRIPVLGRIYGFFETPPSGLADAPLGLTGFAWGGERLELNNFDVPAALYGEKFHLNVESDKRWTLTDPDGAVVARGATGERVAFDVRTKYGPGRGVINVRELSGRPGTRFKLVESSFQMTLDAISKRIKVEETTKDSSMIQLSLKGGDPNRAALFANEVARAYVTLNVKHRSEQAHLSLKFLSRKLPTFLQELERSEDRLNDYRVRTKTIDVEAQTEALLTRIVDVTKQKTLVDLNLQATREQLRATHPVVQALAAQDSALEQALNTIDKQVQALPSTQRDYLRLARDVEVNTQLYTALLANAQQLEIAEAGTTGNVSIIDLATPPEKMDWPKVPLVLAGGIFGGLLIAFVAVQALAAFRGVLRDPLQVERLTRVPIFAVVPSSSAQLRLVKDSKRGSLHHMPLLASKDAADASVEALRSLRSTLRFALLDGRDTTILFTGPTQGVGKTFVAGNFAYLLALNGLRVLIIDADMRRPGLGQYFPLNSVRAGLANVLSGDTTLDDAIIKSGFERLDILASGNRPPPNPGELLERPAFAELLSEANRRYDYVIVDSPPVLPVSDAVTIAQSCGAVFLVSRADVTNGRQLTETISRLDHAGVKISGQVFNGFHTAQYGYGYGYGYGYSKRT